MANIKTYETWKATGTGVHIKVKVVGRVQHTFRVSCNKGTFKANGE